MKYVENQEIELLINNVTHTYIHYLRDQYK